MSFKKFCDICEKEIVSQNDVIQSGFSEWCVFHYKKRRDFCSVDCMKKFSMDYFNLSDKKEVGDKINEIKLSLDEILTKLKTLK